MGSDVGGASWHLGVSIEQGWEWSRVGGGGRGGGFERCVLFDCCVFARRLDELFEFPEVGRRVEPLQGLRCRGPKKGARTRKDSVRSGTKKGKRSPEMRSRGNL